MLRRARSACPGCRIPGASASIVLRRRLVPANRASTWLFPGRQAGQPAEYQGMAQQVRDLGLSLRTARISALGQLVLQVPAPVIADALGFHHTTTTRQHVNAGGPWIHYIGRDHQAR